MSRSSPSRKYRGLSKEARRAQRRRQLVDAGHAVFGTDGYQAASVRKLCRVAELTERYFYESFKSREDLFEVCYDEKLGTLFAVLLEQLADDSRGVEATIEAGLRGLFDTLYDDRHMARILLIEIYGIPYDLEQLYARSIGRFSTIVQQFSQRYLPATPGNAELDLELLATGLVGVCIQMAQRWVIEGFRHSPQQLTAHCMLIFRGLGQQTGLFSQA